jgi:hypothetical protein
LRLQQEPLELHRRSLQLQSYLHRPDRLLEQQLCQRQRLESELELELFLSLCKQKLPRPRMQQW